MERELGTVQRDARLGSEQTHHWAFWKSGYGTAEELSPSNLHQGIASCIKNEGVYSSIIFNSSCITTERMIFKNQRSIGAPGVPRIWEFSCGGR